MQEAPGKRTTKHSWLWALFPLLLTAGLIIPGMTVDAFYFDEVNSIVVAGATAPAPYSLAEVWSAVAERSSEQALGWPMLLSVWGRIAGWSEFAVRALPLFAGMLALAWVYRAGSDLFAPRAGLFAALLLSGSSFFLIYLSTARAFPLVALFTAQCLWSYHRCALLSRPAGRGAQAALLLGATGLLWSHYFAALLLPALGLFHLLFMPKQRRWWWPVLPLALAVLIAMLQLPVFLAGLKRTVANEGLQNQALTAPELIAQFLQRLTNGAVLPSAPVSEVLTVLLPLALVIAVLRQLRAGRRPGAGWLLAFVPAALLLLMLSANAALGVVQATRVRYLMPLWPLLALLAGAGLWRLSRRRARLAAGLVALWLISGAWLTLATDYRYQLDIFRRTDFHRVYQVMREHVQASELLIMDTFAARLDSGRYYSEMKLGLHLEIVRRYNEDPYEFVRPVNADYPYAWLIYLTKDRVGFEGLPGALGRVFCERVLDEWGFTLERYALHSVANCPERPVRLAFDSDIQLTGPQLSFNDDVLRLDAHIRSADEQRLGRYSLALHVFAADSGERVAQGDVGVGPGAIVPLRSELDIAALPPGEYELRVALYDWQTGARLYARDLETGAAGDMLALQHFRID